MVNGMTRLTPQPTAPSYARLDRSSQGLNRSAAWLFRPSPPALIVGSRACPQGCTPHEDTAHAAVAVSELLRNLADAPSLLVEQYSVLFQLLLSSTSYREQCPDVRAGITAPLPASLLQQVHTFYMEQRAARLNPESEEQAWQWATRIRNSGNAPHGRW